MKEYYTKEIRPKLQEVIERCEGEFEKKVVYIAAGALGLSFAFISDIVNLDISTFLAFLIIGWGLLVTCILLNLLSQLVSRSYASKTIDDIDEEEGKEDFDCQKIFQNMTKRNRCTNLINHITTWSMIIGIAFILSFAIINITSAQRKNINKQELIHHNMKEIDDQQVIQGQDDYIDLGYSMPQPVHDAVEINPTINISTGSSEPQLQK